MHGNAQFSYVYRPQTSPVLFAIITSSSPYYFLKYIFRFVLNFNLASQHMLIKTMLITLARVISKDFSNIILRSIVRFNFILNVHSFVIIVIIYVIM